MCFFSASLFWSNRKDERNDLNARNKNHEERNKCVRAFAAKPEEIKSREKINQARRWELDFFSSDSLVYFSFFGQLIEHFETSFRSFFHLVVVCFIVLQVTWLTCERKMMS